MKRVLIVLLLLSSKLFAGEFVSKVWVPDNGNGTYTNPIIDADYSDPDVCRVGSDYYMTASSFNCVPGLPILHSNDLVNWKLVNHAIQKLDNGVFDFNMPQHGKGVWAPSIREHKGKVYIFWGDPDAGIFYVVTDNPLGDWSSPILLKAGKGMIDAAPLWDDDGKMYVVHSWAGSRAGMKSVLGVFEVKNGVAGQSRIVFDGHKKHTTIEGPKFFKKDGYYYIFTPAGGVPTGWQVVLRSKSPFGPYEDRVVMAQGSTDINGPHQGAWVTTPDGKQDWFIHFQDKYAYGRVAHLNPMKWVDGFPVIGVDREGKGCGEPVRSYKKPDVGKTYPVSTPVDSDDFNSSTLGLQWQWHGNPNPLWYYAAGHEGVMRLFSAPSPDNSASLWNTPAMLLQKTPADEFTVTTKSIFVPLKDKKGERAGLVIMGRDYGALYFENGENGVTLSQSFNAKAESGGQEVVNESVAIDSTKHVYMRLKVSKGAACQFYYSLDGKKFTAIGKPFTAKEGMWIGAKVGLFATRSFANNDSGWMDVDWIDFDKNKR